MIHRPKLRWKPVSQIQAVPLCTCPFLQEMFCDPTELISCPKTPGIDNYSLKYLFHNRTTNIKQVHEISSLQYSLNMWNIPDVMICRLNIATRSIVKEGCIAVMFYIAMAKMNRRKIQQWCTNGKGQSIKAIYWTVLGWSKVTMVLYSVNL